MAQWRIPEDDIQAITAELCDRFGQPALDTITEPDLINDVAQFLQTRSPGGYVHLAGT